MKILFIFPDDSKDIFIKKYFENRFLKKFMLNILSSGKSLTFPILAALTPKQHSIELVEGGFNDINFEKKYDLVGISTITPFAYLAYKISDEFRKRGVPVILGGWHASALPKEAKQHADSIVIGEAEEIWPVILKDIENKSLKPFYEIKKPVNPENIPIPRNDIFLHESEVGVQAARGCPVGCEFCAITNMNYRNIFRLRPVEEVIKEIKIFHDKDIIFHDNSLTINRSYSKQLFRELTSLNKKFLGFGNINSLGEDDEFLRLSHEAGCMGWGIGFESLSQKSINSIGKKTNNVEKYAETVEKIHNNGMMVVGFFMFGFDYDSIDIFDITDDFINKSKIDIPQFYILTPYPGTPIFDKFKKEGRILTYDWSKYKHDSNYVVFQPKNMTPEELLENVIKLRKKHNIFSKRFIRTIKTIDYDSYLFLSFAKANLYSFLYNIFSIIQKP